MIFRGFWHESTVSMLILAAWMGVASAKETSLI
jgi:hypothetical protein